MKITTLAPLAAVAAAAFLFGCAETTKRTSEESMYKERTTVSGVPAAEQTERATRTQIDIEPRQSRERAGAGLASGGEYVIIETPQRDRLRLTRGYQTSLILEGENLDQLSAVRFQDASGAVEGVSAQLEPEVNGRRRVRISVAQDANVQGPIRLVLEGPGGTVSAPARISIRQDGSVTRAKMR